MEYWDLFNEKCQLFSEKHPDTEMMPVGLFHLVITLLIQHQDGAVLLTQRSSHKSIFPSKWEATMSVRVQTAEDNLAGAQRELAE